MTAHGVGTGLISLAEVTRLRMDLARLAVALEEAQHESRERHAQTMRLIGGILSDPPNLTGVRDDVQRRGPGKAKPGRRMPRGPA